MESCTAVAREEEKLSKKYKGFREHTQVSLEEMLNHLTNLREDLSKGLKLYEVFFVVVFHYTGNI